MSRQITPTTNTTIDSSSKEEIEDNRPEYLKKPVIDEMEDYYRFLAYQKRFSGKDKSPCVVTPELFDLVTGGDTKFPLFHTADCPVIDNSRKKQAEEMLYGKRSTALIVM